MILIKLFLLNSFLLACFYHFSTILFLFYCRIERAEAKKQKAKKKATGFSPGSPTFTLTFIKILMADLVIDISIHTVLRDCHHYYHCIHSLVTYSLSENKTNIFLFVINSHLLI